MRLRSEGPKRRRTYGVYEGRRVPLLKDGSVPEKYIQAAILAWLKDTKLLHWRQNSGNVFVGNRRVQLGEKGLPDIVLVLPPNGKVLGLEVKSARGQLRSDQREFRDRLLAAGGMYRVVRSLAAARDAVASCLGKESGWTSTLGESQLWISQG